MNTPDLSTPEMATQDQAGASKWPSHVLNPFYTDPDDGWSKRFVGVLGQLNSTHPVLYGINSLIQRMITETVSAGAEPGLMAGDRSYNAGRVAALQDLRDALRDAVNQAHNLTPEP